MLDKNKYSELFVQESHEHLQKLNRSLLDLEKDPESSEHIDAMFRSAHTLKGMALTMDYDQITQLCRTIEELLDKLRKDKAKLTTKLADSLFKCFDLLEEMVDDQSKKVDLEPYLKELQISSETGTSAGVELPTMFQKKLATIRVKMEDLDSLVNLVGELVIAKMQLDQTALINASDEAKYVLTAIGRSISDLHDQAMRLRLVPIEEILNRFPRMVRDLSKNQGKEIKLEMNSFGIELDRTILDAITDPLLHILRNAIDHGIETPSERKKIGKPKSAIIKITASRVGDKVALRVEDDGRGIDVDRIRSMAIKNKILSGAEANSITDDEILSLLGTPGLSGASNVTDVSGRGVGFNVVRRQVEDVGGQVSIETKKSHGTSIMITIPLSLAIIEGLLVTAAEQKYVLPLSTITAILHIENHEIKSVHGTRTIVLRDQIVPVARMSDLLETRTHNNETSGRVTVVVVNRSGKPYGLIVDSIERKQEVVIKRLDNTGGASKFSNATILADGKVALILDPAVLV